eukprot:13051987-Alexandrium_andersonii.AAC.1
MLASRNPSSRCSKTARSPTYVGVGPPVRTSTAQMMGPKPTAQRKGFMGPPCQRLWPAGGGRSGHPAW